MTDAAAGPDGFLYVVDRYRGHVARRLLDADDASFEVVATGLQNPVSIVVDHLASPTRVYVLDGDVYLVVPGDAPLELGR